MAGKKLILKILLSTLIVGVLFLILGVFAGYIPGFVAYNFYFYGLGILFIMLTVFVFIWGYLK
jgi:hypothetical protein